MRFYPAYTKQAAWGEYSLTFFSLLEEGYKQESAKYLMLARIAILPNMHVAHQKDFMRQLDAAAKGTILETTGIASTPEQLKRLLG